MTKQDKIWEAESDARTLSEAEAIKKDPARYKAAVVQAKKMAKESMDKAKAMQKIADSIKTNLKQKKANKK